MADETFLEKVYSTITKPKLVNLFTYQELYKIELGETITLPNGIVAKKMYEDDDIQVFTNEIKANVFYNPHCHDCDEDIYVAKGLMMDRLNKSIQKVEGTVMHLKKGQVHAPHALEDTIIVITFRNPNLD